MNRQCHKRSRTNLGLARTRGPLVRLLSPTLAVTLGASPVYAQQGGDYKITQSVIPGGTYTVSGGFEPSPDTAPAPTPTPTPLATFVVTNAGHTGNGLLRKAITDANASPGFDAITFNIPGAGVQTIRPASPLPNINDSVLIDGYTQPNASANTLAVGNNAVARRAERRWRRHGRERPYRRGGWQHRARSRHQRLTGQRHQDANGEWQPCRGLLRGHGGHS